MADWLLRIRTVRPLAAFPRLQVVSGETRTSTAYHHEGRYRQAESHCLFKYTLEGEGAFRDTRGEHRTPPGYGFLCEISDPATAYYFPADARGPWSFVYACFAGGAADLMVRDLVGRFGPVYPLPRDEGIVRRLLACRRETRPEIELGAAESADFVHALLGSLARSMEAQQPRDAAAVLVRAAREHVQHHLTENLNATDLARALGVSREHLARVLRERLGMSPYQYIVRQKMRRACELLKETTQTSKEIAAALGYDAPHFTRTFKNTLHLTPARFRSVGVVPVM